MLQSKLKKWIRTPKELKIENPFLKAIPIRLLENNLICFQVQTLEGKKQVTIFSQDSFEMSNEARLHDDMSYMNVLNQPQVLSNLVERYKIDKIFTYIGPTLIVMNPYKYLRSEFGQDQMMQIRQNILSNDLQNDQPHIFNVAGKAYVNMKTSEKKQAIVISGESGAGKTQSTKYCMRILTSLSHPPSHMRNSRYHSVQEMILSCNPLLEAFGNSKTSRNNNSSRFGKYIQIYFGRDNTIKGASIKSYLLEKSRVASIAAEERTFHAFYALIASGKYDMMTPDKYKILNKSGCFTAIGIDDVNNFNMINEAMESISFEKKEQEKIWLLLKAILELGNLEFDNKPQQANEENPCNIINRGLLSSIARILEIEIQSLQNKLLKEKKLILKQTIFKAYKKNGCEAHRNTLCKAIYNSIFEFILEKINLKLQPKGPLNQLKSINILDIFGFQDFQENSLEQLCINFTNEKLLKLYNEYIFKRQMQLLTQDGLQEQIKKIKPPTNDDIISCIQGNGRSIFSIINDTTKQPPYTDKNIMNGIQSNYNMSKMIGLNMKKPMSFTIKHSQSPVQYNVQGFKMKNLDKVNDDIAEILDNIQILNCNRQGHQNNTLLNKFGNEISVLIEEQLSKSNVNFIRCIKPNESKQPNSPAENYILTQMRYLGVFQTIQIRKAAFPVRKDFDNFAKQYKILFPNITETDTKKLSEQILREIKCQQNQYMLGNKRVYLNLRVETILNHLIYDKKNQLTKKIQQTCRRFAFASKVNKNLKILKSVKKLFVISPMVITKIEFFLRRQCLSRIKAFSKQQQQQKMAQQRINIKVKVKEEIKPQEIIQQLSNKQNTSKKQSNQQIQIIKNHEIVVTSIKSQHEKVIQSFKTRIRDLQVKQMMLEQQNAKLKQKQKNYQSTLEIQIRQNKQIKSENISLKIQNQNLRSLANQNSQQILTYQQNITENFHKMKYLQQQLNQKQTTFRTRQNQLNLKMRNDQDQIQSLTKTLKKLESKIKIHEKKSLQNQSQIKKLIWQLDKQFVLNRQLQQKIEQKQSQLTTLRPNNTIQQSQIKSLNQKVELLDRLNKQQRLKFEEKQKNFPLLQNQQILQIQRQKDKIISALQAQLDGKKNEVPSFQAILKELYTNNILNQNNIIHRQSLNPSISNNNQPEARRRYTLVIPNRTQNTHDV